MSGGVPPHIRDATVLSQMHHGDIRFEDKHPVLRKTVRNAFVANVAALVLLWLLFRIIEMFPQQVDSYMGAVAWYFFFGLVYWLFAQALYVYGLMTERAAIRAAQAPNRRYAWHSHYNTAEMTEEDLKKLAETTPAAQAAGRHEQSSAVGAGLDAFLYAGIFALLSFGSCAQGVHSFFTNLF